jgi:hypothetical protein
VRSRMQDRNHTPRFGRPALTVDDFLHFLFSEGPQPAPPLLQGKSTRKLLDPQSICGFIHCFHCLLVRLLVAGVDYAM